jgi:hypothetical protein
MKTFRMLAIACTVSALALTPALAQTAAPAAGAAAGEYKPNSGQPGKDVVWVPTPQALVDRMLQMAKVTKDDTLIDLGSGDGRTVITAAKLGVRSHGIEYNPDLVALSQRNAKAEGVSELATFERADIFQSDFSRASVITLFLLPNLNLKLRPILLEMKPGTRVVSNSFDMGDWEPDDRIDAGGDCTSYCRAMKWVVPARVAGAWKFGEGQLQLTQSYQKLEGTLTKGGKAAPISAAKMDGTGIVFTAGGESYTGQVNDKTMTVRAGSGATVTATKAD